MRLTKKSRAPRKPLTEQLQAMAASLLLRRFRYLQVGLLLIGLLVSVYLVAQLLFWSPEIMPHLSAERLQLRTDDIDQLELWLEERETGRQERPSLAPRVYFAPEN